MQKQKELMLQRLQKMKNPFFGQFCRKTGFIHMMERTIAIDLLEAYKTAIEATSGAAQLMAGKFILKISGFYDTIL